MSNQLMRATYDFTRRKADQSAACALFVRDTVSGFLTTAHHTLMLLGIAAICILGIMFVKPEIADHLKKLSPFAETTQVVETEDMPPVAALLEPPAQTKAGATDTTQVNLKSETAESIGTSKQQQWVTNWLSKRYRVAKDATNMLVSAAYLTASELKLDPLLILSVMAIESGFNPFAESPVGAQGLMQVMSKVHHDKFEELGGVKAALNPVANIRVGSQILKDYVKRGGSVEAGLKLYVGAGAMETDFGYGAKVLAEYNRLKDVAMGKKVPIYSTSAKAAPKPKPVAPKSDALLEASSKEAAPAEDKPSPLAQMEEITSL